MGVTSPKYHFPLSSHTFPLNLTNVVQEFTSSTRLQLYFHSRKSIHKYLRLSELRNSIYEYLISEMSHAMDNEQPTVPDWNVTSTSRLGPYTITLRPPIFETESENPSLSSQTLSAKNDGTPGREDSVKPDDPTNKGRKSQKLEVKDKDVSLPPGVS